MIKKVLNVLLVVALSSTLVVGCSANQTQTSSSNSGSASSLSSSSKTVEESTYRINYKSDGAISFKTRGLDTDQVSYPDDTCTIHYGTLYNIPIYEGVGSNPEKDQAFASYSKYTVKDIDLTAFSKEAVDVEILDSTFVESNGYEFYKVRGGIIYKDLLGDDSSIEATSFIGYSTVIEGSLASEEDNTLVWFAVVDNPGEEEVSSRLENYGNETLNSFKVE